MLCTLRFFPSKCSLFHNANLFGSCIIHILYTGCAKIKKKNNSGAKRLRECQTVVHKCTKHLGATSQNFRRSKERHEAISVLRTHEYYILKQLDCKEIPLDTDFEFLLRQGPTNCFIRVKITRFTTSWVHLLTKSSHGWCSFVPCTCSALQPT